MELDEIFAYVRQRSRAGAPAFERSYVSSLENFTGKYERLQPLYRTLEGFLNGIRRPGDIEVLLVGSRFLDLIERLHLKKYRAGVLVGGRRDLFQCLRRGLPYVIGWRWKAGLLHAYQRRADSDGPQHLEQAVLVIKKALEQVRPKVIVLETDSLFLQRSIVFAARSLRIPVATIQHGLFMESADPRVLDGYYSDYMLVWGEFFQDLYVRNGILPESQVRVLGYPYSVRRPEPNQLAGMPVVCFFGQPWENYDDRLRKSKATVIENVIAACKREKLKLVYRPHPSEDRFRLQEDFPELGITGRNETLQQAIRRYQIFVSLTSTALVEAALRGKQALQILDEVIASDNFESLGVCRSVKNDPDSIRRLLNDVKSRRAPPDSVSSEYILVPDNLDSLGERFANIIDSILLSHGASSEASLG